MRLFSPQALLGRLSQRLAILMSGPRNLPVRQQTLRNTLTWSYDLLEHEEQQVFRQLSVFPGDWTLEAAEVVVNIHRPPRSEEHTSELQSRQYLVCRLLLEKK